MRFNSVDEVWYMACRSAALDYTRHVKYSTDINPYCTSGARGCFERGFDGAPQRSYEVVLEWDFQYQRGRAARILKDVIEYESSIDNAVLSTWG